MGLEGYSLFFDIAKVRQAEYLKASAVSKNGTVPVHEVVQPACFLNQFMSGP